MAGVNDGGYSDDITDQSCFMNGSDATNGKESQEDRKLFVGGLAWETTDKELREYFSKFGEIENINLKTDPNSGRSRGFAFLLFAKAESLDKITNAGDHVIQGKKVDPKKAKARKGKIFVGGLPTDISDEEVKTFFGQFGKIVETEMPFDKMKNQRKGFCFITYETEQIVNEILRNPKQVINGKEVDVKKATPRPADGMGNMRGGMGMMRGRGRGRGGFGGPQGGWGGPGYGGGYGYDQSGYGYDGSYEGGYDYSYGYGNEGYGGYDYGNTGFAGKQQRGGGAQRQNQRHQPY